MAYVLWEELFEYDKDFAKNLGRVVGKETAEILLVDLEMKDEYSRFPDKMKHSIVFAKTKFQWKITWGKIRPKEDDDD